MLVPFSTNNMLAFNYVNGRYRDMDNNERYEANIRGDFKNKKVLQYDSLEIVCVSQTKS